MAKRVTPREYSVPGVDFDRVFLSEDVLEDIIGVTQLEPVNRSSEFLQGNAGKINTLAILCALKRKLAQMPSEAAENRSLSDIENAAEKLSKFFPMVQADNTTDGIPGVVDGVVRILECGMNLEMARRADNWPEQTNRTEELFELFGAATSKDILTILANILDLLQAAAALEMERRSGAERAEPSFPDRDFACRLIEVFEELFGRSAGFSRADQSNEPQGPLIRFLRECFWHFDENTEVSSHTLGDWVRFYQKTHGNS